MTSIEPTRLLRLHKLGVGRTVIDPDGLAVRDEDGYERIAFTMEGDSAELVLTRQGDDAVALSAHSSQDRPFYPGPSITLCDGQGQPVVSWHVEPKGAVNRLMGDERRRTSHFAFFGGDVTVVSSRQGGQASWSTVGRWPPGDSPNAETYEDGVQR